MSKELRPYQKDAKDAVFSALNRGRKKMLITLPGGTGKTVICSSVMHEFSGRKCWISHEESLSEQSAISVFSELELMSIKETHEAIYKYGGLVELLRKKSSDLSGNAKIIHENIGMIKADIFDIYKPIVICSAQTLWRRLDKIPKDHFEVIVADEGDLFGSMSFKAPLDYFTPQLLLGATATGYRSDNLPMEDIFEEIVYDYPISQAIADKYLTEINAIVVKTSTSLDSVHTLAGDFNQKELTEKVNVPERNYLIVNKYLQYCEGQQFICFGCDVQHVIDLHEAFREKGVKTAYVVSDKDRMEIGTDRKQIVRDFRAGEIVGLVNFNIFSAGFDHRDCGCVILACPTKSKRKFLQQLFRVTRLKNEPFVKKFGQVGTVLDIIDGTSKHVLVNTRELDKGLPIEERVFVSQKNKELLIEARNERMMITTARKEDKKVELFPIPQLKINTSFRMSMPANEAQLAAIERMGYPVKDVFYTQGQIGEIFGKQRCSENAYYRLKNEGYDVSGFISVAQASAAFKEIEARKQKPKYKTGW